ncbi:MAG: hypothetical protein PHQ05_07525 [Sterolibacterium sp.]|nr:hypothetical protein [Sterolibacterium sp.]
MSINGQVEGEHSLGAFAAVLQGREIFYLAGLRQVSGKIAGYTESGPTTGSHVNHNFSMSSDKFVRTVEDIRPSTYYG